MSGLKLMAGWLWLSGSSLMPITSSSSRRRVGSSASSYTGSSSGSHGLRGTGISAIWRAPSTCVTTRWMSVGPSSCWTTSWWSSATGTSQAVPEPNSSVVTSSSGGGASPVVHPPAYAVWNGVSRPGPDLDTARPGRAGSK